MPDRIEELLEELLRWQKFAGVQQAKSVLKDVLTVEDNAEKTKERKIAYELSDGSKTGDDIASRLSVGSRTVNNWRKDWSKQGLMYKNESDKYVHLISLESVGIEVPDIPDKEEE